MGIGDWGLGIGDWGLGPFPNPQSPIPHPQTPIPNPHFYKNIILLKIQKCIHLKLLIKFIKFIKIIIDV
jgi:hypothetical protein